MPCSSIVSATTAAPNSLTSGSTFSQRSRPSSRLIELTMQRPPESASAARSTLGSVESSISGLETSVR